MRGGKILPIIAGISLLFLLTRAVAEAADPVLTCVLTEVSAGESFTVHFSYVIPSMPQTTYYLQPCFYEEGSNQYFGCIEVNGGWVCEDEASHADFLPIETDGEGNWEGNLVLKAEADTQGEYYLKIRRFTESGKSYIYSNEVPLTILVPLLPTPTIEPSPTPTPVEATGTVVIREAVDEDGQALANAKLYLDGTYLHHYTPETLTFCPSCTDSGVALDFDTHILRVEKSGYETWEQLFSIDSAGYREFMPILVCNEPDPTKPPTGTPSPTSTPTPMNTPTTTKKPSPSPTSSESNRPDSEKTRDETMPDNPAVLGKSDQ